MEDKQHVWTFRVFLCRTHIYADAAHPESALDKKAAAGLLGGKGKQIFSVIGTGGRGVDDLLCPDLFRLQFAAVVELVMVVCGGVCLDGHV